jgi:hypothetical protein
VGATCGRYAGRVALDGREEGAMDRPGKFVPTTRFGLALLHPAATSRLWLLSLILALISESGGHAEEIRVRPNVVLILADDND